MAQATVFNPKTGERKVVTVGDPNAFTGGFVLETPNNNLQKVMKATGSNSIDSAGLSVAQDLNNGLPSSNLIQYPTNVNYVNPTQSDINAVQQPMQQAGQQMLQYSQPNTFLSALKGALMLKTQPQNEQIGQSALFNQAGLTGMASLQQSLGARSAQLGNNIKNLTNLLNTSSGIYQDQYNTALTQYQLYKDEYDKLITRMQSIDDNTKAFDRQIQLLQKQQDLEKEMLNYKSDLENPLLASNIDKQNFTASQLADAIKQVESGGNYQAKGGSGEFGAYQFMPGTWAAWSDEYAKANEIYQSLDINNPENQDAVANWKIQQWLSQDYTPSQIASMWNSGSPSWEGKIGTNKYGQHYDVPNYVNKVLRNLSSVSGGELGTVDKGTLVMQLGKMVYGTRISDAEGKRISDTIDAYVKQNPSAGISDLRQDLMKKFLGFDLVRNQEIGNNLINTLITAMGEDGLASFDMVGLAKLLNEDNIVGAITKVENQAMIKSKQIDPDGYLGESAAKTTLTLSDTLKKYINSLPESPIGNASGTIQDWLGRFKKGEAANIKSQITAIIADWRKQYAGVNVTATEIEFLNSIAPQLYDTPDNFMIKLNTLNNQIETKFNSSRELVGLPSMDTNQILNKNQRVGLYGGQTSNTQSNIQTMSDGTQWKDNGDGTYTRIK